MKYLFTLLIFCSCSRKFQYSTQAVQAKLIARDGHNLTFVTTAGDTLHRKHYPRGIGKFDYTLNTWWTLESNGRETKNQ